MSFVSNTGREVGTLCVVKTFVSVVNINNKLMNVSINSFMLFKIFQVTNRLLIRHEIYVMHYNVLNMHCSMFLCNYVV